MAPTKTHQGSYNLSYFDGYDNYVISGNTTSSSKTVFGMALHITYKLNDHLFIYSDGTSSYGAGADVYNAGLAYKVKISDFDLMFGAGQSTCLSSGQVGVIGYGSNTGLNFMLVGGKAIYAGTPITYFAVLEGNGYMICLNKQIKNRIGVTIRYDYVNATNIKSIKYSADGVDIPYRGNDIEPNSAEGSVISVLANYIF